MANDRRVKYTKMVLASALIKLLGTKPISRITIKELCAEADVNRATFYAHYTDQFDQLKQIEADFINGIYLYLTEFEIEAPQSDVVRVVGHIFEYIVKNRELCRVLLGTNGDIDFQDNLMRVIGGYVMSEWHTKLTVSHEVAEYLLRFLATGCIGVVSSWLTTDNRLTSHEMAELVVQMANGGIRQFLTP